MPRGYITNPIDPGRSTPVLDLRKLTVKELASLVDTLRDAVRTAENVEDVDSVEYDGITRMWHDLCLLRLEVRSTFLVKFFEARSSR